MDNKAIRIQQLKSSLEKEEFTCSVEQITVRNRTYFIHTKIAEYPDDPRAWDNPSYLVLKHRYYDFPIENELDISYINSSSLSLLEKQGYWIEPVYMYEHSGIVLSLSPFSCSWDSGIAGYIYIDQKRKQEYGFTTKEEWFKTAEREIKIYNQYLEGSVYDYIVWDVDNHEIIDDLCDYSYYPESMGSYEKHIKEMKQIIEKYVKSTTVSVTIERDYLWINNGNIILDITHLNKQENLDMFPISVEELQNYMIDNLAKNKLHPNYAQYKEMLKDFMCLDKNIVVFTEKLDKISSLSTFNYFTSLDTAKTLEIVKKYLQCVGFTDIHIKEIIEGVD